ncbi:restriction endonuclease subunit S [Vibrio cholerae]
MSEVNLPEGWAFSTLAKSISAHGIISDGDWVESKDQDPNGSIRLIQLADIGDGDFKNKSERFMTPESASALNCTFLKSGDVLIARMPDPLGRACIFPGVEQEAVTVVDVCLIRTGEDGAISNKLLTYWINSPTIRNLIAANASGTTRKRITRKKLEQFEFPLPPLAEQKVIADKLDTLLAQVETSKARLERIPQILKTFRQSVLAAAVSGKLTEEWRESQKIDIDSWADGTLGDFVEKPTYGSSSKSQPEGTVPVLRMGNLQDGKLDWTNLVYTSDPVEIDKYKLSSGDVLFNRTNSPELVGKTSIYRGEREAIYAGYLIRIVCNQNLNSEYLNYLLNSPDAKDYCYRVKSDGVSQSNINAQKLKAFPVNIPTMLEQTEIVRCVEELFAFADRIEQNANAALERVNNLTQSILAKAFRGELTADWRAANPDLISGENSAEALLKKIKAERAALRKRSEKKTATRKKA